MTTKQHQNYPFLFILLFYLSKKGMFFSFSPPTGNILFQVLTQDLLPRDHDFPSKNAMFAFKTTRIKCVCDFSWPNTKHCNSRARFRRSDKSAVFRWWERAENEGRLGRKRGNLPLQTCPRYTTLVYCQFFPRGLLSVNPWNMLSPRELADGVM